MTHKFELLIFDWDGTLMDSVEHIVSSLAAAAADLKLQDLGSDKYRNIIGLGLSEAMQALYPGASQADTKALCDRYRYHFVEVNKFKSRFFDGVLELLQEMRGKGLKLAVATGKGRSGLDRVFNDTGCGELFHASRCADESGSKPQPHMLREIMTELAVPAERSIMIGDTSYDMEMANNAGIASLAVSYGVHNCEQLKQHMPLECLPSIEELHGWLHAHTV